MNRLNKRIVRKLKPSGITCTKSATCKSALDTFTNYVLQVGVVAATPIILR